MAYRRHHSSLHPVAADAGTNGGRHLVHENHSAVPGLGADQPGRHDGPGYLGLLHATAAVYSAERYPPVVRRPFLLGIGRFLDGADGLPAVADGA